MRGETIYDEKAEFMNFRNESNSIVFKNIKVFVRYIDVCGSVW